MKTASLMLPGLLFIVFAIGLHRGISGGRSRIGPILLGIFGAGLVGSGVFSTDPDPFSLSLSLISLEAMLHGVSGGVAFSSAAIAPFFISRRLGKGGLWRKHRVHAVVTGIAMILILFLGFPPATPFEVGLLGLMQRFYLGCYSCG